MIHKAPQLRDDEKLETEWAHSFTQNPNSPSPLVLANGCRLIRGWGVEERGGEEEVEMKGNDDYKIAMKKCTAAQAIACKCGFPF